MSKLTFKAYAQNFLLLIVLKAFLLKTSVDLIDIEDSAGEIAIGREEEIAINFNNACKAIKDGLLDLVYLSNRAAYYLMKHLQKKRFFLLLITSLS